MTSILLGSVPCVTYAVVQDDWGADLNIYGWLPIISIELEDGTKDEITRDDILKDFDIAALWSVRVRKGPWSLTSDFIYLDISKKSDASLLSLVPSLATLDEAGFNAWIVTACTLAKSPSDPLHQRLQPLRYLHDCSDCFRLEQNSRVGFAPTEKRRLNTAHAKTRH